MLSGTIAAYLKCSGCRDSIIPTNIVYNSNALSLFFIALVFVLIQVDTFLAGIIALPRTSSETFLM